MRLDKNLFKSLNEASKKVVQPEIEEEVDEIEEEKQNYLTSMILMIKMLLIMSSATTK